MLYRNRWVAKQLEMWCAICREYLSDKNQEGAYIGMSEKMFREEIEKAYNLFGTYERVLHNIFCWDLGKLALDKSLYEHITEHAYAKRQAEKAVQGNGRQ